MQLSKLKEQIDQGKTARLLSVPTVPSDPRFTVRIEKDGEDYVWQHTTTGRPSLNLSFFSSTTDTMVYPAWEQLLEGIKGIQTRTRNWTICDDALIDYLPPERKTVPNE